MKLFHNMPDFIFQLDTHLVELLAQCGYWTYFILAFILFLETGVLVFSFLPGDSLLVAVGILARVHHEKINIYLAILFLILGAFIGNTANYHLSQFIGKKIIQKNPEGKIAKGVESVHRLMQQYGGWAIIYSRFMPFIRSIAPFAAGMSHMNYSHFQFYNIVSAFLWIPSCTLIGFFIGGGEEGSLVTKIMIGILILALIIGWIYKKQKKLK